jgi:hypothetical protein
VKEKTSGLLPSFITKYTKKITIFPTDPSFIGLYTMTVVISDYKVYNKYNFTIEITSQPPKLTSTYQSPVILNFG